MHGAFEEMDNCLDLPVPSPAEPWLSLPGGPDANCRTRCAGAAEDNLGRAGNVRRKP